MPYKVVKNDPRCKGEYALVKEDGKLIACHTSEASAIRQMRAIYASESKNK